MPRKLAPLLLLLTVPLLCSAYTPRKKSELQWALKGQPGVVTLVNLHLDPKRHKLSSVNYLRAGFIPVCTPVTIESLTSRKMVFRVDAGGVEYEYGFHKSMPGSPQDHLDRIFGDHSRCPEARIAEMSPVDQQGIQSGQVTAGMSKDAVAIAIGYPPEHATASLELDTWRYWRSRLRTMLVSFQNDLVSKIQE